MRLLQMGRASLFSLALAPIVGTSVNFGDSQWSMFIGLGVILSVAGIIIARKSARSRRRYASAAPKVASGDKLSGQLVALSSAAIIAVYSAGYYRTNAAAHQFAEQSAQIRGSVSVAAITLPSAVSRVAGSAAVPATSVSRNMPAAPPSANSSSEPSSASTTTHDFAAARQSASATTSPSADSHKTAVTVAADKSSAGVAAKTSATPAGDQAAAAPAAPPSPYKDGFYTGWGSCPHGNIQASVSIASGLIVDAYVSQCETRYPCAMLDKLTAEVVYQQSGDVDVVTGATESAYAFHVAVTQALAQAMSAAK
jgi:uncharacterized protein with FMN-binding domain